MEVLDGKKCFSTRLLSIYGPYSNGWDVSIVIRWSHHCPWEAITQYSLLYFVALVIIWMVVLKFGYEKMFGGGLLSSKLKPF